MAKVSVVIEQKGGPGSGFEGHQGIPGHKGGSLPRGSSAPKKFDRQHYESMDMMKRREEWGNMSVSERDKLVDAGNSIRERQNKVLEFAGERPAFDGDIAGAISKRVSKMKELIPAQAVSKISNTVEEMDKYLAEMDIDPEIRHKLAMEAIDTLAVQDNESLGRTLGDHGIHHIAGDIETANAILDAMPNEASAEDRAAVYISSIFHDAGYLTAPSHIFIDEGHTRWSQEHYDKNVRPLVAEALGDRVAGNISHTIRTHDTTDMDWAGDPVASSVRVADNAALFSKEKLPPVFRYIPGAVDVLKNLGAKKMEIGEARTKLLSLIESTDYPPAVKSELGRAAKEMVPITAKFTLGMLGGVMDGVRWSKDHPVIQLRYSKAATHINKYLDVGQRQFGKWAEAYGYDPKKFTEDLAFKFTSPRTGAVLLESEIVGGATKSMKGTIVLKKGNMTGLAKHILHMIGADPDFFTKCVGNGEVQKMCSEGGYDIKALCARAHKLAIGHWPAQDKKEYSFNKREALKFIVRLNKRHA